MAELADRFFPAFLVMLERLAQTDYFAQAAPESCPDGHPYYWDSSVVRSRLVEHLGPVKWPLTEDDVASLNDTTISNYVEGLFQIVSKPTDSWYHDHCGSSHPKTFDSYQGRYDYTVKVNALFDRFDTGLRLQNGKIKSAGSQVLAPRLADTLPTGGDDHLARLLASALAKYKHPSPAQRWEALCALVDAYDRIKTVLEPADKKRSVGLLIKEMAVHDGMAEHLDGMFRALTSLSNDLTIRHHEVGKVEITDDVEVIDFLFYSYYNVVRFALLRLYNSTPPP